MTKLFASILILMVAIAPLSAESKRSTTQDAEDLRSLNAKIGGYADTEWISTPSSDTFKAHRFILNAGANVHPKVKVYSEIEFEYGGDAGNDGEIKLEQAWVDYKTNDAFNTRAGIVLVPFGYVNRFHDSDLRDTTNRPVFTKYIVPTTWFDVGLGWHGVLELEGDLEANYQAYFINGLNANISGTSGVRSARPSLKTDNNKNKAFAGRLGISPSINLEGGLSYYTGLYDAADDRNVSIVGVDVEWKHGPFEWVTEYARTSIDNTGSTTIPAKMWGYYTEVRYHFFPEFMSWMAEGFDRPTFTVIGRVGQVDLDESVRDQYDITQTTLGLNFRPIEALVFKLEYEWNAEAASGTNNDQIAASVAYAF